MHKTCQYVLNAPYITPESFERAYQLAVSNKFTVSTNDLHEKQIIEIMRTSIDDLPPPNIVSALDLPKQAPPKYEDSVQQAPSGRHQKAPPGNKKRPSNPDSPSPVRSPKKLVSFTHRRTASALQPDYVPMNLCRTYPNLEEDQTPDTPTDTPILHPPKLQRQNALTETELDKHFSLPSGEPGQSGQVQIVKAKTEPLKQIPFSQLNNNIQPTAPPPKTYLSFSDSD
jgi:hypothetical protein